VVTKADNRRSCSQAKHTHICIHRARVWWLGRGWVVPVYPRGRVCAVATAQQHSCVTGLHIPLCWVADCWCVSGSLIMAIGGGFEYPCSPAWVGGGFGVELMWQATVVLSYFYCIALTYTLDDLNSTLVPLKGKLHRQGRSRVVFDFASFLGSFLSDLFP
jgi:hypothetical protein